MYLATILQRPQAVKPEHADASNGSSDFIQRMRMESLREPGLLTDKNRPDIIIIAEAPWKALGETIDLLSTILSSPRPDIFLSANGYWWPPPNSLGLELNALSVTAKVHISSDRIISTEPHDAGLMVGPVTKSSLEIAKYASLRDIPFTLSDDAENVIATKCLVNMPLSLNFGLNAGSITAVVNDLNLLISEANQIHEFALLMEAVDVDLIQAPGFDLRSLIDLSHTVCQLNGDSSHPSYYTHAAVFASLLSKWRGERTPSIGQRIRASDSSITNEIEWLWGRVVQKAANIKFPMPHTESLYNRAMKKVAK